MLRHLLCFILFISLISEADGFMSAGALVAMGVSALEAAVLGVSPMAVLKFVWGVIPKVQKLIAEGGVADP